MKDPAFLFYPNDWLGGTMGLTRHQKGCYLDLLIAQFNGGPLSVETIKTLLGSDQAVWTVLRAKFKQDANGRFFNERLETEKNKRKAFVVSRKNNLGKNKSTHKVTYESHMDAHMENENENRNENRNKNKNKNENENDPDSYRDGPEKIKYGENVELKESEYQKLCKEYGDDTAKRAIEYLDAYKHEKNYNSKSDYHAIKRWVIEAISKKGKASPKKPVDYIIAEDGSKIYEKDIDFSKLGK